MISWEAVTSECARPYRGGPVPKGTIQIFNDETTESMPVPQAVARYIRGSKQFGETPYASVQELKDAVRAVTGMVARSRALRMLERRDYSYKELLVRLTNEGFDKATCVSGIHTDQTVIRLGNRAHSKRACVERRGYGAAAGMAVRLCRSRR